MTRATNTRAAEEWRTAAVDEIKAPTDGSIAIGPFGSRMKAETYVAAGVPVVRGMNIGDTRALCGDFVYIPPSLAETMRSSLLQAGDLFFPHRGAIGEVGIVDDGTPTPCMLSTSLMKLSPDPLKADARFLFYFFRSARGRYELLRNSSQVGTPGIATPLTSLRQITVLLPPLCEQRAIAHVLGVLDDKIDSNRRLAALLEETVATLFRARFVDFVGVEEFEESPIGRVPSGWRVGAVSDLCEVRYGYTASANEQPVGPKFLRVKDINKQPWIDWATVPYCEIDEKRAARFRLLPGDLVVARMADPGKSAIVLDQLDAVCASYLVRLRPFSLQWAYFLHRHLRSQLYESYVQSVMSGSVQKNINARGLTAAPIVIPPDEEVIALAEQVGPLYHHQAGMVREATALSAVRDALLPRLISGEIRVPDTADSGEVIEPVATLAAAAP